MSRSTSPTARLLTKVPRAKGTLMANERAAGIEFAAEWNALEREERRQIRRLVRVGRPQESQPHAQLAVQFAAYQRSRAWFRYFWLWIVPLTVAAVISGSTIHPIVIGLVLGAAASALMVRRNFRRVESINGEFFAGSQ